MHHAHTQTQQPLTEIRLYGHLRARFGRSYRLAVRSAAEAIRALGVVVPGFREYLATHSAPGYRVWLGADVVTAGEQLNAPAGSLIRLVPVTAGAKSELGQIIIGAALIYFAPAFGTTALIGNLTGAAIVTSLGFAMVLGGVSQLLAGNPASDAPSERPENLPSYAFNGAVNTTAQGNPVPVLYGRLRVGSQVISTGLSTAALAIE
jgi:predicted phage tail protein